MNKSRAAILPIISLVFLWVAQSFIAVGFLLVRFGGSKRGFVMHLVLIAFTVLVILLPFISKLFAYFSENFRAWLFSLIFGTLNLFLILIYGLIIVGYYQFGGLYTFDMIVVFIMQIPTLILSMGGYPLFIYLLLFFIWIVLIFLYRLIAINIVSAIALLRSSIPGMQYQGVSGRHAFFRSNIIYIVLYLFSVLIWLSLDYKEWQKREFFHTIFYGESDYFQSAPPSILLSERQLFIPDQYRSIHNEKIKSRPVVLILVDALRADQMHIYGHPNANTPFLSALYKKGEIKRAEIAYSACTLSFCGILSSLSSKYRHQLISPPIGLQDYLAAYGYKNRFILSADHTNTQHLKTMYGPSIDIYFDGTSHGGYANDDRYVLQKLKEIDWSSSNPSFTYIHLMAVHRAGLKLPEYSKFGEDVGLRRHSSDKFLPSEDSYKADYQNGILQADHEIEEIFNVLQKKGILKDAIVIISADHGEYLGEFGRFGHTQEPFEPVTRIPLLIYDAAKGSSYPPIFLASQVDIAPTILFSIGASIPTSFSGLPLQLRNSRSFINIAAYGISGIVAKLDNGLFKYLIYEKDGHEILFKLSENSAPESVNLVSDQKYQNELRTLRLMHQTSKR